jgi:hypothetical protein
MPRPLPPEAASALLEVQNRSSTPEAAGYVAALQANTR